MTLKLVVNRSRNPKQSRKPDFDVKKAYGLRQKGLYFKQIAEELGFEARHTDDASHEVYCKIYIYADKNGLEFLGPREGFRDLDFEDKGLILYKLRKDGLNHYEMSQEIEYDSNWCRRTLEKYLREYILPDPAPHPDGPQFTTFLWVRMKRFYEEVKAGATIEEIYEHRRSNIEGFSKEEITYMVGKYKSIKGLITGKVPHPYFKDIDENGLPRMTDLTMRRLSGLGFSFISD